MNETIILPILVGILSALVTALVVYQIVNVIVFEKRLAKFKNEIREAYKKELDKVRSDASGLAIAQLGLVLYNAENYASSIQMLTNALSCLNNGDKDGSINKEAMNETVDMLYKISQLNLGSFQGLTREQKTNCYVIVGGVKDKVKREAVLRFIDTFQLEDTKEN